MLRTVIASIILIATLITSFFLLLWVFTTDFDRWFYQWLLIGAIVFLLGAGIVLSALLFERAIRERQEQEM